ncbi:Hypothetical predicted protein [Octopus vulgaris]|uniref:Uncharacterized protein n=1 Tax=Octopus vulgaris TaxID=6645 RepID=A0AA36EYU5_OCTVU|nr:Hypothetical predicted protein [Octopus vulgaris]
MELKPLIYQKLKFQPVSAPKKCHSEDAGDNGNFPENTEKKSNLECQGGPQRIETDLGRIQDLYRIINFAGLKEATYDPFTQKPANDITLYPDSRVP